MPTRVQLLRLAQQLRRAPCLTRAVEQSIQRCAATLELLSQQRNIPPQVAAHHYAHGRQLLELLLACERDVDVAREA